MSLLKNIITQRHSSVAVVHKLFAYFVLCPQVCKLDGCSLPVFFDSAKNHVHDFCSKRHADKAIADGQWMRSTTSANVSAGASKCKLPGCQQGVYVDPVTRLVSYTPYIAGVHHTIVFETYTASVCPSLSDYGSSFRKPLKFSSATDPTLRSILFCFFCTLSYRRYIR